MTTKSTNRTRTKRVPKQADPSEAVGTPVARPPINQAAIDLLRSWCEGDEEDEQEQRETLEALKKGIDEERERLGMRLLFHDDRSA